MKMTTRMTLYRYHDMVAFQCPETETIYLPRGMAKELVVAITRIVNDLDATKQFSKSELETLYIGAQKW